VDRKLGLAVFGFGTAVVLSVVSLRSAASLAANTKKLVPVNVDAELTAPARWGVQLDAPLVGAPLAHSNGLTYLLSEKGALLGVDAAGRVRSRARLALQPVGAPLEAADGGLWVASRDGMLSLLDASGRLQTERRVGPRITASPLRTPGGTLFFAADHELVGLSASGEPSFRFEAWGRLSALALGPTGRVFVGSEDDHLYAFSAEGRLLWKRLLGHDVDHAPWPDGDGGAFVSVGDEVVRLSGAGQLLLRVRLGGRAATGPVQSDGVHPVCVGTRGPRLRLVCFDGDSGRVVSDRLLELADGDGVGLAPGLVADVKDRIWSITPSGRVLGASPAASGLVELVVRAGVPRALYRGASHDMWVSHHSGRVEIGPFGVKASLP
jgi:outer membrane protein assembly factor BamB